MALKKATVKGVSMDSLSNYSKMPMKKPAPKKMPPKMVASRKKKAISNAADKMFGQKYSK